MPRVTTTERSRAMRRTNNGILIPDVPIMAGGNLPNAVKGVTSGGANQHAVDLGLPSGLLWADVDIDLRMRDGFAATPFTYSKSFFSCANIDGYEPINNSFSGIYNWNQSNWLQSKGGQLNGNIPMSKDYDAARYHLGKGWRIPSSLEWKELFQNTINYGLIDVNNVRGLSIGSRFNDEKLFFPLAGYGFGENWLAYYGKGLAYAFYMIRDFFIDQQKSAYMVINYNGGIDARDTNNEAWRGVCVRAVKEI